MPTTNPPSSEVERRISSEALEQAVERALVLAFAPLHKRVFDRLLQRFGADPPLHLARWRIGCGHC